MGLRRSSILTSVTLHVVPGAVIGPAMASAIDISRSRGLPVNTDVVQYSQADLNALIEELRQRPEMSALGYFAMGIDPDRNQIWIGVEQDGLTTASRVAASVAPRAYAKYFPQDAPASAVTPG